MSDRQEALKNLTLMGELKGHVERVVTERDALRAEVERLRGDLAEMTKHRDLAVDNSNGWRDRKNAWKARADQATAHAAELRAAMETIDKELMTIAYGKQEEISNDVTAGESYGWCAAHDHIGPIIAAALARTPAQSLAAVQARALREAADTLEAEPVTYTQDGYGIAARSERANVVASLREKAERLEKEAADAQPKD